MKLKKTLASLALAGTMAFTGCNNVSQEHKPRRETTFVTTAENVKIEPYYGADPTLMEGIVVTTFAYGNGLRVRNIEKSEKYAKGSPEYEALRPLLTVEQIY